MMKSTYGTGCFMILNTGSQPLSSDHALLTTVAYRLKGQVTYALEGSIFVAGAAVQWLRDKLKIIDHAGDTETIAASTEEPESLVVVPAFTGLGAPYWDPEARGAILGLTRDTGDDAIVTATLTAVAYQTRDLLLAMRSDGLAPNLVRVDGGMVNNNWFAQRLADVLAVPVDRPANVETTVLGAAYLAGLHAGLYKSLEDLASRWQLDRRFDAKWDQALIDQRYDGWTRAVQAVRHFSS
jgi:glycerol kinase